MKKELIKPDFLVEELKKREMELVEAINALQKRLPTYRQGSVVAGICKNTFQYKVKLEQETIFRYLPKKQQALAVELSQGEYEARITKELQRELRVVQNCLRQYKPENIRNIYDEFHPGKQRLITPLLFSDEMYIKQWRNQIYPKMGFGEDAPEYYTESGERVRSKSEVIIANKLRSMGVPYLYEVPLHLENGKMLRPDFVCLNVRSRKEIYWEHFGMMDDEEYANHAIHKLNQYQKNDFFLGDNLIATFESVQNPLSTKTVERIIEQHLM